MWRRSWKRTRRSSAFSSKLLTTCVRRLSGSSRLPVVLQNTHSDTSGQGRYREIATTGEDKEPKNLVQAQGGEHRGHPLQTCSCCRDQPPFLSSIRRPLCPVKNFPCPNPSLGSPHREVLNIPRTLGLSSFQCRHIVD